MSGTGEVSAAIQAVDRISPGTAESLRLAALLAQAFRGDAHIDWLLRPGAHLEARRAALFTQLVEHLGAELYATRDRQAAALWYPPAVGPGWRQQGAFFMALLGIAGPVRALRRGLDLKRMEGRHPASPHFHLVLLGTDAGHRRGGRASALLRRLLGQAGECGKGVYLETSSLENVAFYRRHGFSRQADTPLSGGLVLHSMIWEPAR